MKKLIWEGKELTVKEASLLIWEDLVKYSRWKRESKYLPLVQGLAGKCPYCEFYKFDCEKCLLFKGIKKCGKENSLFVKWYRSEFPKPRRYWAQKIYNRILKMPDLLPGENPPENIESRSRQ